MAVIWCKPPVIRATWWKKWAARVAHKQHLNRQLAFEAMMEAMLARVLPEALPGLLVEYESACDRLAALLPPEHQAPELWKQWTVEIERLMRKHQTPPTTWSLPT